MRSWRSRRARKRQIKERPTKLVCLLVPESQAGPSQRRQRAGKNPRRRRRNIDMAKFTPGTSASSSSGVRTSSWWIHSLSLETDCSQGSEVTHLYGWPTYTVVSYWYDMFLYLHSVLFWSNKWPLDICVCFSFYLFSHLAQGIKLLRGTGSRAARFLASRWQQSAAPPAPIIVICRRVSLSVASPRALEQGWQRGLGGLHKCIMNNWVGEARDCRWHSQAVICLDVSDCFYSLMGALPIKAQFTASHEVARIRPPAPPAKSPATPPPAVFSGGYFWMVRAIAWSRVPIMWLDPNYPHLLTSDSLAPFFFLDLPVSPINGPRR